MQQHRLEARFRSHHDVDNAPCPVEGFEESELADVFAYEALQVLRVLGHLGFVLSF